MGENGPIVIKSLPMRERELKQKLYERDARGGTSLPMRERELKPI